MSKWSKENIQERLKSSTRKKPIWKEVSVFLRASGYDRDDDSCKVRIRMLLTAYRNFNYTKRWRTGTAPQKKPPCYEEIDAALEDKPTTMPSHLISSSETSSNIPTDNDDLDIFDNEVPLEDLINATNIPTSTSKTTLAVSCRRLNVEQNESSLSNENADDENSLGNENVGNEASCLISTVKNHPGSFYFKKNSNKKHSRSNILLDRLNYLMDSFMKAQSQADNEFLSNLLEKEEQKNEEILRAAIGIRP